MRHNRTSLVVMDPLANYIIWQPFTDCGSLLIDGARCYFIIKRAKRVKKNKILLQICFLW